MSTSQLYELFNSLSGQGGCRTLKTLKSDQVVLKTLKNKYFSVENLENLEMRVYYRESFQQYQNVINHPFSESVSRDLMKFFRRTLKTGKKITKKP